MTLFLSCLDPVVFAGCRVAHPGDRVPHAARAARPRSAPLQAGWPALHRGLLRVQGTRVSLRGQDRRGRATSSVAWWRGRLRRRTPRRVPRGRAVAHAALPPSPAPAVLRELNWARDLGT